MKRLIPFLLFTSLAWAQLDSVNNFAQASLTSGVSSSATTLILTSGQGSRFPISGYNLTLWDFGNYGTNINTAYRNSRAEIVRVTARSGDTLTVSRAQEGTTACNFTNKTCYVSQIITKKMITDIGTQFTTNRQELIDSVAAHRVAINKNIDSIAVHRTDINTALGRDSVDIPIITTFGGSSFGAQSTSYVGLNGASMNSAESSTGYAPIGINGRVTAMYFQSKTNTMTATSTITFQYADSSTASLTASALTMTIGLNQKSQSVTGKSVNVTASQIGGFKFVNPAGTGSITLPVVTLIIRTALN